MRERVYPAWIAKGRMKADDAAREIATLRDILERLERAQKREQAGEQ